MEIRWPVVSWVAREATRTALRAQEVAQASLRQHAARIQDAAADDANLEDA